METGHSHDYAAIALDYAREAVADKKGKKFCHWVRQAAKRHLDDLKRWNKPSSPYYFDDWHANDPCDFIEKLPHVEGEWDTPTLTIAPAHIFILAVVFGWRRRSNGKRRFSNVYIEMARKNAKSTLTAGVALYCLTCEKEVGPQVVIGATTGDQANKVFLPAKKMVEKTPDLQEAFGVKAWAKSITCADNGGFIQPINANASTQDGWNPHCGILDELHAHKNRDLYDVIRSAFGARKNPLMWVITTAGYNSQGVCFEQRTFVSKFLDGLIEADHYFGIIFTLDKGDDPFDPSVWVKANPLLGISVTLESMEGYAKEAKNSPASLSEFQTKRLNIWTTAKDGHINITLWNKCSGRVDIEELRQEPCCGGLDLAAVSDMNALSLSWKLGDTIKTWVRYYLPEETVRPRTERGNVPYQLWADAGLIVLTPGNVTDYAYIEKDIEWACSYFNIRAIGFDPWNARDLATRLLDKNVPMEEFRQGIPSFNGPMKEIDRCYTSGKLEHGGHPILAWNASNIVARKDVNENIAPDRRNSMEKIDGYVSLLMSVGLLLNNANSQSVYQERGVLTL